MKIIITEEQNEQLNRKIKLAVEKLGLTQARELFGDNIIRQTYINNPLSYLNQFNNLTPIEKDDKIYYVDNDNIPIFFYFKQSELNKYGYYYINNDNIFQFGYTNVFQQLNQKNKFTNLDVIRLSIFNNIDFRKSKH